MRAFTYLKKNVRRTPYQAIAASMVMFATFLTLFLFVILAIGSQRILKFYESKPQAIAFFKDNTQRSDIIAIENALKQTGRVVATNHVSKDEALAIYKEQNKDKPVLMELVTANILPESLEISTQTPNDLIEIAKVLEKEPVVEQVIVPQEAIQYLTNATSVVRWVGSIAIGFLILFAFLVILMITGFKIRLKRNEIEIMKLLGASSWFIKAPFILEGIFYGVVGSFLGWLLSYVVIWYFTPQIQVYLTGIPANVITLPPPPLLMLTLLGVNLLFAIFIGALGSYGAVRRYMRL